LFHTTRVTKTHGWPWNSAEFQELNETVLSELCNQMLICLCLSGPLVGDLHNLTIKWHPGLKCYCVKLARGEWKLFQKSVLGKSKRSTGNTTWGRSENDQVRKRIHWNDWKICPEMQLKSCSPGLQHQTENLAHFNVFSVIAEHLLCRRVHGLHKKRLQSSRLKPFPSFCLVASFQMSVNCCQSLFSDLLVKLLKL